MQQIMNFLYDNLKHDPLYWEQFDRNHELSEPKEHSQSSEYWYEMFKDGAEPFDSHYMSTYTPIATHHSPSELEHL